MAIKQLLVAFLVAVYVHAADYSTYTYKTIGDLLLSADVYLPNVTLFDKYPVIFVTHGGAYIVGSKSGGLFPQEIDEVLSRGWAIVSIDYRLSPAVLLSDIVEDSQDAYNWVRTELAQNVKIDPDRIAVFGGSAGGGLSLLNGYMLIPRPVAVISFYPFCTNFTDSYSYNPDTPLPDSYVTQANNLRQNITEYNAPDISDPRNQLFFGGLTYQKVGWLFSSYDPNEPASSIIEKLIHYSPAFNVDDNYPPTYIAHGLSDTLVPYNQSVMMAAQLNSTGIVYVLDLVPGANHVFDSLPQFWQDHVLPAFDFIEPYLSS